MSKDAKWKVVIYGISVCILFLCYVAVKICNSGYQGWALALVVLLIVATFFNIYLMCKREDILASETMCLPCVMTIVEGNNLPCVMINNPVHEDIMNTLERIIRK